MAVTIKRPVRRKLDRVTDRKGRALILTIYPSGDLGFRYERTRHEDLLPVQVAAVKAAEATAQMNRKTPKRRPRVRRGRL